MTNVVSRQIDLHQTQERLVDSISRMMSSNDRDKVEELITYPFDIRDETEHVQQDVHTFVPGPTQNILHASKIIKDSIETDGLMPDAPCLRGGGHEETDDC